MTHYFNFSQSLTSQHPLQRQAWFAHQGERKVSCSELRPHDSLQYVLSALNSDKQNSHSQRHYTTKFILILEPIVKKHSTLNSRTLWLFPFFQNVNIVTSQFKNVWSVKSVLFKLTVNILRTKLVNKNGGGKCTYIFICEH